MSLINHVNVDELLSKAADHPVHKHTVHRGEPGAKIAYMNRYQGKTTPKYELPAKGLDGRATYQILHDELDLDGVPALNLASFVNTWASDEALKLSMENINKNIVDGDEYPASKAIHERCVNMLANLWHADTHEDARGTATTGSSEAIMLGGLAMKRRWQERMMKAGKSFKEPGPNVVMGAHAQVALEKMARYQDIECRLVNVTPESNYVMDPKEAIKQVDENTIGVFVILGSTYTGNFELVTEMAKELDAFEERTGISVPIHVDAASGGFVTPFAYPDFVWDFKIPRVHSINASGHKYGNAAVGCGWIVWRSRECLPKHLIFELHYLGATDESFGINFSRPFHPILSQMFNFINLGFEGYRALAQTNLHNARVLSRALEGMGYYKVLSNIHRPKPQQGDKKFDQTDAEYYVEGLPVVTFCFTDEFKEKYPHIKQMWMQTQLRTIGWIVPNYALPPTCEKTDILRVVVRESLGGDLIAKLVTDILQCTEDLLQDAGPSYSMSVATKKAEDEKERNPDGSSKQFTYSKPC